MAIYDIGALGDPATGILDATGFSPVGTLRAGRRNGLRFGLSGFIGFESGAIYSEECRNPR